jgi:flagellar basal body-associated protein FliL
VIGPRRLALALPAVVVALAVLIAQRWSPPSDGHASGAAMVPCWVMLGPINAVTGDGSTLRLRVALDTCDGASRDAIDACRTDLEAIVRVVVARHARVELERAEGIERLRVVLARRLGEHLQGVGASAVRSLAIDQFVLRRI